MTELVIAELPAPVSANVQLTSAQTADLDRLNLLLASGAGVLRVARIHGVGVGHVLVVFAMTDWVEQTLLTDAVDRSLVAAELRTRRSALLTDLVVAPAHRQKGIGAALVADAVRQASGAGHSFLTLFVTSDNAGARRLYEREHFQMRRRWPGVLEYVLPL